MRSRAAANQVKPGGSGAAAHSRPGPTRPGRSMPDQSAPSRQASALAGQDGGLEGVGGGVGEGGEEGVPPAQPRRP
eukprot:CAMPEP_0172167476 /NCGR_PEP_ID=MMETSP1050-20130122/9598_1 /TAXON_ID=233186 /ORGANISM="Cryptomonas curvata, Strain CCAP979/52" /LENGTH=75 /DNA_ID=CAMNT_0012838281 /DNA_START=55 /DNA_END=280 /DNA_ORIENTATION=+